MTSMFNTDYAEIKVTQTMLDKHIIDANKSVIKLFDDTYEHTAVNDTDEIRSVLFIDIVKPLPFPINVLNWCVIRMARLFSYVNIPLKRHKEWQKIFYGDGNG